MPAMNPASGADGSDISHERSDLGDHEVVTIGRLDLRSLKFTHTKQRGAKSLYFTSFPSAERSL